MLRKNFFQVITAPMAHLHTGRIQTAVWQTYQVIPIHTVTTTMILFVQSLTWYPGRVEIWRRKYLSYSCQTQGTLFIQGIAAHNVYECFKWRCQCLPILLTVFNKFEESVNIFDLILGWGSVKIPIFCELPT